MALGDVGSDIDNAASAVGSALGGLVGRFKKLRLTKQDEDQPDVSVVDASGNRQIMKKPQAVRELSTYPATTISSIQPTQYGEPPSDVPPPMPQEYYAGGGPQLGPNGALTIQPTQYSDTPVIPRTTTGGVSATSAPNVDVAAPPMPVLPYQGGGPQLAPNPDLPTLQQPNYFQAANDTSGPPHFEALSKLGKLLFFGQHLAEGAMVGSTQRGLGQGYLAEQQNVNEQAQNQLALAQMRQNLAFSPAMRMWQIQQQQAEIAKNLAQAQLFRQSAGEKGKKGLLEEAQALAARYKPDGSGGFIDTQTGKPADIGATTPVGSQEMADALGVEVGDHVPLGHALKAAGLLTKGLTTVNTDQGVYERNRITGDMTRLGGNPRQIMLDIPVPVLDRVTNQQGYATRRQIINDPSRYQSSQNDVYLPILKQTMKEYNSTRPGTAGGNILAFNTAIGHLGMLWDAIAALDNGQLQTFNRLAQTYARETGSEAPTNFNTVRNAVNAEVAKVFKGGVPADAEIQEQGQNASVASSPNQLYGNVRTLVGLMSSRLAALDDRYTKAVGEPPEDNLLNPESYRVLQRIGTGIPVSPTPPTTVIDRSTGRRIPKAATPGAGAATPSAPATHFFDARAWAAANPGKDVNKAIAKAKAQGFEIRNQ